MGQVTGLREGEGGSGPLVDDRSSFAGGGFFTLGCSFGAISNGFLLSDVVLSIVKCSGRRIQWAARLLLGLWVFFFAGECFALGCFEA
jgi:hypothetical protein